MVASMMARALQQRQDEQNPDAAQNVSFIGEMAQNAPHLLLPLAKRMRIAGHSMQEILDQTGWFTPPGVASHWKTEVPDTAAKFNPDFERELTKPGANRGWINTIETPMKHAFDSPLWQHYPDLGDIQGKFHFGPNLASGAAFNPPKYFGGPNDPAMTLAKIRASGHDIGDLRRSVLHELQHGVQWKEFWPRGGSDDPNVERGIETVGRSKDAAGRYLYDAMEKAFRDFQANNPALAQLSDQEAFKVWQRSDPTKALISHQLNELGFGAGTSNQLPGLVVGNRSPGFFGYKTLEGEVEARNVEMRDRLRQIIAGNDPQAITNLGLGPIDPKSALQAPWLTEDMPPGLQHRVYEPFRRGRLGGI